MNFCYEQMQKESTLRYFTLGTIRKGRLPKGGGRGVQKMPKKEMFTSRFEETRGGRVPQNLKFGETSFMDGP